ncbi:sialidase family protein [Pedobacter arcticus]|uniref:sialidase family protein n=1 Tax=Pedobacter arcticus TaxID=752140 RepID=UPI0003123901|nr:sialidase family protein [Pedobacter arcticus]
MKATRILLVLFILLNSNTAFCQLSNPFPGTVVFETKDPVNKRVASPSILVLPNGDYLASHDYDKGTSIHISKNKGKTWTQLAKVSPIIWANLFEHRGNVYLMGTTKGWGNIVIHQSKDNGKTWSVAADEETGLLAKGLFHTGPVPIVKYKGKIWRAYEEAFDLENKRDFHAFAICADEKSDLLKASSWQRTNSIRFDEKWLNAKRPNWFEGNIVVTPEGKLIDFMRLETWAGKNVDYEVQGAAKGKPRNEIAAIIDINEKSMKMEFKNEPSNFVHFPGAESKFTIRYDSVSKSYWTITNKITSFVNSPETFDGNWNQRNVLVLLNSKDLKNWEVKQKVLKWNEGAHLRTWDTFGFQYIDWQFEKNDIVFVSRTSWYGLRYHDANMITFHRIENFRDFNNKKEPEDLSKYTKHPTLLIISPANIAQNNFKSADFNVSIKRGNGLAQTTDGSFRFNNEPKSTKNEKEALKAGRYFDIEINNPKIKAFSVETLNSIPQINRKDIKLKWMYSVDGASFYPITKYLFPLVVERPEYMKLDPPLYLQIYEPLNKIDAKSGVTLRCYIVGGSKTGTLRCYIVGGSKTGTTLGFNENILIGGRVL